MQLYNILLLLSFLFLYIIDSILFIFVKFFKPRKIIVFSLELSLALLNHVFHLLLLLFFFSNFFISFAAMNQNPFSCHVETRSHFEIVTLKIVYAFSYLLLVHVWIALTVL